MKKVIFAWPPLENPKGYATVGQNRQFQWFKTQTNIYPIIPAISATMLFNTKNQVSWVDSLAEELNDADFGKILLEYKPDYLVMECPTPLINRYIEVIAGIKKYIPSIKIILCGDHVSSDMEIKCEADHIVKGGKWYYEVQKIITGEDWKGPLPHINRQLTRWWLYAYKNGNFKYIPATYIMAAQDCWHGKCRFCSWAEYHKECETRPVEDVLNEIEGLVQAGFKEIFDDSGTFPVGQWLKDFCNGVIDRGLNKFVSLGCNMRFGALSPEDFRLMAKAGFRMVLWGMESVNQKTLTMLNKDIDVNSISQDLILAKGAGLSSHLTVMFGYPWEGRDDVQRTYDMVKYWLLNGYAFSAQATICIPYPITPLWKTCKKEGLLTTENWDEYDMTKAIMKLPGCITEEELFNFQKKVYNLAFHPKFLWQRIKEIRCLEDIKYYLRIGQKIYDRFGCFYEISKATRD